VIPVGRRAALVEVDDAGQALSLALWARSRVEADDVVPAAASVLIDGVDDLDALPALLAGWAPEAAAPPGELVEVAVTYDGPDLAVVAEAWGIAPEEVAARHASREYVVAFCGFAPGFAYLTGDDETPEVPRRDSPRSQVPAGSVALAGPWTGIYPTASPGGWQLLGTTDATLWDQSHEQPALLPPGTRVRFRDAAPASSTREGVQG
jgi:KipI family sensor histidine kinase inhibitor